MIPLSQMLTSPTTSSPAGGSAEKSLAFAFVLPAPAQVDPIDEKVKTRVKNRKHSLAFQSKQMNDLVQLAVQFAESSASIMITGESGTGKELFSRLIHEKSGRPKEKFHAFNCAAVPEALIESEIFGHEKGAFTGAHQKRIGYFERADGGTLLLDEISEIPLSVQAKLLRVLEEQEIQPIGSDYLQKIDVRIVATSNRDLKREVAEGRFRADLFHRLNVLEICIPPLRDRVTDIPLLVLHFIEKFRGESKNGIEKITREAMSVLCRYSWPGNVRELRNVIHRACILASTGEITPETLPDLEESETNPGDSLIGLPLAVAERRLIITCLKKFHGNKKSAAEELGVTARTLSNKLKLYREQGFPLES
jgi:DNA-binding NtrC family response regulator